MSARLTANLRAGLRAGQVRAIFRLPQRHGYDQEPLLYVHWFRPFRDSDAVTRLPPTAHATRDHFRHVEVVPASTLLRSCQLLPRFRQDDPDPEWTPENILDHNLTFSFNRYQDFHAFCALSRKYPHPRTHHVAHHSHSGGLTGRRHWQALGVEELELKRMLGRDIGRVRLCRAPIASYRNSE